MRALPILGASALAALLAACASGGRVPSYGEEMRRLQADCDARDGILVPSGASTGRPQTDYFCRITGGASRIPNN